MRILQIEEDAAFAQSIELMLRCEGLTIYSTDLGSEGVSLAKIYGYDLILLDLCLSDVPGMDVLRSLRIAKINTPVMIVSAEAAIDAKVKALRCGADDYMTKPLHKEELVARIHALVRRSNGHTRSVIVTGNIAVDLTSKTVTVKGRPVSLTAKEYHTLELLSLRRGTTLTREMFLNHLYGGMDEPDSNIITVYISKVRRKIAAVNDGLHHIDGLFGRGYLLRDPDAGTKSGIDPAVLIARTLLDQGPTCVRTLAECPRLRSVPLHAGLHRLKEVGHAEVRSDGTSHIYCLTDEGKKWAGSLAVAA